MKRGSVTKQQSELVALWIPRQLLLSIDTAVRLEDSDRSKFIRRAVRNHIRRSGIVIPPEAVMP